MRVPRRDRTEEGCWADQMLNRVVKKGFVNKVASELRLEGGGARGKDNEKDTGLCRASSRSVS